MGLIMNTSVDNCGLDLFNEGLTCENCWRVLPNKNFFTKNGCIWCTTEKMKKERKNERKYK